MNTKIVFHLTNAMFALGSARRKCMESGSDDIEAELADITNQLQLISDKLMPEDDFDMIPPVMDVKSTKVASKAAGTSPTPRSKITDAAYKAVDKLFFRDKWEKVESIEPAELIGKQHLMTFNVNTRQLAIYYADSDAGLQCKGSTLKGVDLTRSAGKTLRVNKVKGTLLQSKTDDDTNLVPLFDDVVAVGKTLTGRINKHTLLLRTW